MTFILIYWQPQTKGFLKGIHQHFSVTVMKSPWFAIPGQFQHWIWYNTKLENSPSHLFPWYFHGLPLAQCRWPVLSEPTFWFKFQNRNYQKWKCRPWTAWLDHLPVNSWSCTGKQKREEDREMGRQNLISKPTRRTLNYHFILYNLLLCILYYIIFFYFFILKIKLIVLPEEIWKHGCRHDNTTSTPPFCSHC